MAHRYLSTALLLAALGLIGGWACMKMLEPAMMMDVLQAFTFC